MIKVASCLLDHCCPSNMGFEFVISNDDGRMGILLLCHRGVYDLLGKGHCRRLAKLVPSVVSDNGTAAEVAYGFAE